MVAQTGDRNPPDQEPSGPRPDPPTMVTQNRRVFDGEPSGSEPFGWSSKPSPLVARKTLPQWLQDRPQKFRLRTPQKVPTMVAPKVPTTGGQNVPAQRTVEHSKPATKKGPARRGPVWSKRVRLWSHKPDPFPGTKGVRLGAPWNARKVPTMVGQKVPTTGVKISDYGASKSWDYVPPKSGDYGASKSWDYRTPSQPPVAHLTEPSRDHLARSKFTHSSELIVTPSQKVLRDPHERFPHIRKLGSGGGCHFQGWQIGQGSGGTVPLMFLSIGSVRVRSSEIAAGRGREPEGIETGRRSFPKVFAWGVRVRDFVPHTPMPTTSFFSSLRDFIHSVSGGRWCPDSQKARTRRRMN